MRTITKITIFCAILIPALILGFSSLANAQDGQPEPTPPPYDWWGADEVCPKWAPQTYPGVEIPTMICVFDGEVYDPLPDEAIVDGPADPTPTAEVMFIRRPGRNR